MSAPAHVFASPEQSPAPCVYSVSKALHIFSYLAPFLPSDNPSILCPVFLFSFSTTPFYSPNAFSSFTPLTLIFILPAPVHLPLSLSPSPRVFFLPFFFGSPSVGRSVLLRWLMCSLGTVGVLGHIKVVASNCTAFRADDRKEVEKCNVKAQL